MWCGVCEELLLLKNIDSNDVVCVGWIYVSKRTGAVIKSDLVQAEIAL